MDIVSRLTRELSLGLTQVQNAVKLFDEGNTIPFVARYRKELTGEMDENVLRDLSERLGYLRKLEERKEEVIRLIGEQGKLTPELEAKIVAADSLQEVDDLYLPFQPKRRTRAMIARERGLEPLAALLRAQSPEMPPAEEAAAPFVDPEKGVPTAEAALAGAMDIVAEEISDEAEVRKEVRGRTSAEGTLAVVIADPTQAQAKEAAVYQMYFDYREPLAKMPPHRVLAINRGEREGALKVKLEAPRETLVYDLQRRAAKEERSAAAPFLKQAAEDSYDRLISPSIEREVRAELTVRAEEQAIRVFSLNLRNLLLQPPIRGRVVLGIDPAYRTGCKWAVVSETSKLLETGVIYPTVPQNDVAGATAVVKHLLKKYKIGAIAIGNGTGSRETEAFVADILHDLPDPSGLGYVIVSEAGASVYSASKLAGQEFPELDVSVRGAISIARRLQDPLAELVKIEPKAIGVGQYQHDVDQGRLEDTLGGVVESVVNSVGVDLNTASPSLLSYVAGVTASVAKNIVAYRDKVGHFASREELMEVSRLGEATFTQCAGFLRIPGGSHPFDNTSVHPESYEAAEKFLRKFGFSPEDVGTARLALIKLKLKGVDLAKAATDIGVGLPTLRDIIDALEKPGRDPRDELPKPLFRTDVLTLDDLKPGMILKGTVRNVVDFGAFIDIGVKHDGLAHVSELSDRFVKHPADAVAVGDVVRCRVLGIDLQRSRISLSLKGLPVEQ
ncbi:MAG TPA: Tex family protein [Bacillota bacterium]